MSDLNDYIVSFASYKQKAVADIETIEEQLISYIEDYQKDIAEKQEQITRLKSILNKKLLAFKDVITELTSRCSDHLVNLNEETEEKLLQWLDDLQEKVHILRPIKGLDNHERLMKFDIDKGLNEDEIIIFDLIDNIDDDPLEDIIYESVISSQPEQIRDKESRRLDRLAAERVQDKEAARQFFYGDEENDESTRFWFGAALGMYTNRGGRIISQKTGSDYLFMPDPRDEAYVELNVTDEVMSEV